MTQNYSEKRNEKQYFICEYCELLEIAKKRVENLCSNNKKAYYKHIKNDYVVYARL